MKLQIGHIGPEADIATRERQILVNSSAVQIGSADHGRKRFNVNFGNVVPVDVRQVGLGMAFSDVYTASRARGNIPESKRFSPAFRFVDRGPKAGRTAAC